MLTANVKLEQYGAIMKVVPLLLTFISSAENMSSLEQIKINKHEAG
jgi:hypothetical protein